MTTFSQVGTVKGQNKKIKGILNYTITYSNNKYEIISSTLEKDGLSYCFIDKSQDNYTIINKFPELQKQLNIDSIKLNQYLDQYFSHDSTYNLKYTNAISESENINGFQCIKSPFFYKKKSENDTLNIIFTFYGEVILYRNLPIFNNYIKNELIVLDKVIYTKRPKKKYIKKNNFIKITNVKICRDLKD